MLFLRVISSSGKVSKPGSKRRVKASENATAPLKPL